MISREGLWAHQGRALDELQEAKDQGHKNICITSPTGGGKCLGFRTLVMMFNGIAERSERVIVGDELMGPDGLRRVVSSTCVGFGEMYRITPQDSGVPFTCNGDHLLSLWRSGSVRETEPDFYGVVNIPVSEYVLKDDQFKRSMTGYRIHTDHPGNIRKRHCAPAGPVLELFCFDIEPLGVGDYYGFEIDFEPEGDRSDRGDGGDGCGGDPRESGLFLLGDCTVTHNTRIAMTRIVESGVPSVMYTHRKVLATQTGDSFSSNGIHFGMRASGWSPNYDEKIQLAMVQTESLAVLTHRSREIHRADEVFVDEAHSNSRGRTLELLERHTELDDSVRIGLTATPLGIGHAYDKLIIAGTNSELRACGSHVPAYMYGPDEPSSKLVGKVEIDGGECGINKANRMAFAQCVFGSVIENYWEINPAQAPTILFAPGVAESVWFCEQLNEAGISAAHVDGSDIVLDGHTHKATGRRKDDLIEEIRDRCERGDIKIVCNRFCLREGVDWPFIQHGIFATVFGSLTSYVQAGGRILRAHESMNRVTISDHGGNYWRHGSLNADRNWDLMLTDRIVSSMRMDDIREGREMQPLHCVKCNGIRYQGLLCHHCGYEIKIVQEKRPVLQIDGTLKYMANDKFRQRRYLEQTQSLQDEWIGRMTGIRRSKKASVQKMTFNQLEANFAREHDWRYAPRTMKMMPINPTDWYRAIHSVPMDQLT